MNILGLSGKKQSGKNTFSNWLFCLELSSLGVVDYAKLDNKGRIIVPANIDGKIVNGILDLNNISVQEFLTNMGVDKFIKQYSFADPLKQFCIDVLGLSYESCYGTDEQKNLPTHLNWEDMPGVITQSTAKSIRVTNSSNEQLVKEKCDFLHCVYHEAGSMSGREILQWFGTDICRRIFDNCWINATINKIKQDQPALAIITDLRFENEVKAVQKAGGKVVRLTRSLNTIDEHESEKQLDNYTKFDYILDNKDMYIEQQNEAVYNLIVKEWKFLNYDKTIDKSGDGVV
jgi:hypothetical protein